MNFSAILRKSRHILRRAAGRSRDPQRPLNLLDIYGEQTLNDIFKDHTPVSIYDRSLAWIGIPPKSFVDYVVQRRALPFDGVPPNKAIYKQEPTFMIVQMHRLWLTAQIIKKHLKPNDRVLDLGAFPFALDIVLREYLKFNGKLDVTVNLALLDQWKAELDKRRIDVSFANLDPYVKSTDAADQLSERLNFADSSINFVIFSHVIEHLYHPLEIFKEAYRVLKPGGRLLVSSDNAFMIDTLLHICRLNNFLHEPVQNTSAMAFHFWRGHNRFFSAQDIAVMLESVGFKIIETNFCEVCYNAFSDVFFHYPLAALPRWRADILTRIPEYRNEIIIIARK